MSIKTLRAEITMTAGDPDVYGWSVGWGFDIADALYIAGEPVPAEWEYKPGISVVSGEADQYHHVNTLLDMYHASEITGDDMRYWGAVLSRYSNLCRLAGRDY